VIRLRPYLFLIVISFLANSHKSYSQILFNGKKADKELSAKIHRADRAIRSGEFGTVHSLLVVQDGHGVFESYYNGWKQDSLHQRQSATKSLVATLLGCALQEKFVKEVKEPISRFFDLSKQADPRKQQIRIEDLLTQRHGMSWQEGDWNDPKNSWRNVISSPGDWYGRILDTPMDTIPGLVFNYSNAAPALVSAIIQKASGIPIDSFVNRYLFRKLGITRSWFWPGNGGPAKNGLALVSLTSRDMAKLGQLYLQDGRWNGESLIPAEYVRAATSPQAIAVGANGAYTQYDYGYFWWMNPVTRKGQHSSVFLARGAGGQHIIVDRKRQLVVVITAWNMTRPNHVELVFEEYLGD